ncbi:MAG TPA: GGDEF domain-containing protein [Steroidobacteraceae bacterium]|jgi:diguanylate cyclase (GGDEF)-like protein|nr:GGDEF domain-containing protein [Steroidobacteraceae bacterium]
MSHDLLNSVAATTTHRDRDELDRSIARLLLRFLELHSVTVLRLSDEGEIKRIVRCAGSEAAEVEPVYAAGMSTLPALADFPAWQECALRNEVVQCNGADGRLLTVFPIHGSRESATYTHAPQGLLVVEAVSPLAQRETDLVQGILGILRNHLALLDYGELDSLTGLLNRKTFESHFDKLRQRLVSGTIPDAVTGSTAQGEPSWLALIDIDHFKLINDGYGHLFGDEVLLLVSQLMKRSFRGADQLFRFGGEEFVVLLEQASEPGAQIVLERLRTTIGEYEFPQVGHVTISVGYTRIDSRDVSTTCVERADAALYYAKSHGRDNVQNCEALTAAGAIAAKLNDGDVELF